jgi:predicted amidohydrolase
MSRIPNPPESGGLLQDPADLFAQLWDTLDEAAVDHADTWAWMSDERVNDIADFIEDIALSGALLVERVEDFLEVADEEDRESRTFAIMMGLDRALIHANPFVGSFDQASMTGLAARYVRTGKLSTESVSGAVLPRAAYPERPTGTPTSLLDAFTSVVRVSGDVWTRTAHEQIPTRSDFTRLEREGDLTVACVPFLDDPEDLVWESLTENRARRYRIFPAPDVEFEDRVAIILENLDASGAMIGIAPELALSEDLLTVWQRTVRANRPPVVSRLRWLLVGTGSVGASSKPVNRGVLIDRLSGEILLTQDKIYPFTLTKEQLADWNLTPLLGTESTTEDIVSGGVITVTESRLGRLVILVCEDLAKLFDLGPGLREHGISHALAPVFANETELHHWEHAKAKEYATETGALVVVANSLVVARLCGINDRPVGTALAHSPERTQLGHCEVATDMVTFTIKAGALRGKAGIDIA